jgi:peptidoglycan/LPS O-acetylase OafA/YrhL
MADLLSPMTAIATPKAIAGKAGLPRDGMSSTEQRGTRFYRPELDVLRFCAFLFVFLAHTLPLSQNPDHWTTSIRVSNAIMQGCGFGLSLFFTLSAFLICELLLRERDLTARVSVKQFYIRRILRIWPLYYFCLGLGVLFSLTPHGDRSAIAAMGWFAVFLGSWRVALHGLINNPAEPLWSISFLSLVALNG